jgi:hypothetical protein
LLLSLLAVAAARGRRHGDDGNNGNNNGNDSIHSDGSEHGGVPSPAVFANTVTCACMLCHSVSLAFLIAPISGMIKVIK